MARIMHQGLSMKSTSGRINMFLVILLLLNIFPRINLHSSELFNWDVINRNGEILFTVESAEIVTSFSEHLMLIKKKNLLEFRNYNFTKTFSSNMMRIGWNARKESELIPIYHTEKRLYGYIDETGNIVISPQFNYADNFNNYYAVIGYGESKPPRPSFKYGLINKEGQVVIPAKYDSLSFPRPFRNRILASLNSDYFLITIDGNLYDIRELDSNLSIQFSYAGKYGFFVSSDNGGIGIMNWDASMFIPPVFRSFWAISSIGYIVDIDDEKRRVLIDHKGNHITIPNVVFWTLIGNNYITYMENDKMGVFNELFMPIIPPKYEYIESFKDGIFVIQDDDGFGYIDESGKKLTTKPYDRCYPFSEGYGLGRWSISK